MSKRKHTTPEQKVLILRELLENQTPISQLAEKYQVHANDIYNWKKKLFEQAADDIFKFKYRVNTDKEEEKNNVLKQKIQQKDEVIAELVQENITLKKNSDGMI